MREHPSWRRVWTFFCCFLLPPIMISEFGCGGSLSTIRNGVDDIVMETASNGHLIRLVGARDSKESVSVIRSPGNWLLLTINDVDVDLARIRRLKPSAPVIKVDITLFETAVQIGMRFSGPISSFEIVEDRSGNDLLISVFLGPS